MNPAPVLHCERDNVAEFNAALRRHCPEAFELAKALHGLGMLDGLAGAKLAVGGPLPSSGGVKLSEMVIEAPRPDNKARKA